MDSHRAAVGGHAPDDAADPERRVGRIIVLALAVVFVAIVVASLLPMLGSPKDRAGSPGGAMPGMTMPGTAPRSATP